MRINVIIYLIFAKIPRSSLLGITSQYPRPHLRSSQYKYIFLLLLFTSTSFLPTHLSYKLFLIAPLILKPSKVTYYTYITFISSFSDIILSIYNIYHRLFMAHNSRSPKTLTDDSSARNRFVFNRSPCKVHLHKCSDIFH